MALAFDPELAQSAARLLAALQDAAPVPVGDWRTRRALVTSLMQRLAARLPEHPDIHRVPRRITATDGTALEAVWFSGPADTAAPPRPAVVYLHGGGMILGSVELYERLLAGYVAASGTPILAVDYRLAPEHPSPVPLEDAYSTLRHLHKHATELGVDARRIGVMGDSAGGGLAAGVALLSRERSGPSIAKLILIYPMLDDRNLTPDPDLAPFAFWTYDDNATGWNAYLAGRAGGSSVKVSEAPGRCDDFAGLPPAYIEVGELDIFRDEAVRFAQALAATGTSTELRVVPGVPHTFDWIAPSIRASSLALAARTAAMASI